MLKRLTVAVAALFVLASSAFGAGTIPGFSLAQQQDSTGVPLVGCKLYTIQAGTVSTPQNAYQDSALTLPLSNPVICDAYGRLPQIFLADGSIKLRLTKSNGVQVFAADGILVVGASSGGGGGSPVDPTTIIATADLKARYGTGVLSGFVRGNGRTIGSATSGATERANADAQTLFEYLCGADLNLVMSGGRGASCNADWVANKTLALPDYRGRAMAFLDDMGNTAAARLSTTNFGTSPIVLGAASTFLEYRNISLAQLPTGITVTVPGSNTVPMVGQTGATYGNTSVNSGGSTYPFNTTAAGWAYTTTFTSNNTSGSAMSIIPPTMLATIYIKL